MRISDLENKFIEKTEIKSILSNFANFLFNCLKEKMTTDNNKINNYSFSNNNKTKIINKIYDIQFARSNGQLAIIDNFHSEYNWDISDAIDLFSILLSEIDDINKVRILIDLLFNLDYENKNVKDEYIKYLNIYRKDDDFFNKFEKFQKLLNHNGYIIDFKNLTLLQTEERILLNEIHINNLESIFIKYKKLLTCEEKYQYMIYVVNIFTPIIKKHLCKIGKNLIEKILTYININSLSQIINSFRHNSLDPGENKFNSENLKWLANWKSKFSNENKIKLMDSIFIIFLAISAIISKYSDKKELINNLINEEHYEQN